MTIVVPRVSEHGVLITARLMLRPITPEDKRSFIAAVDASREDLAEVCPLHREGESDELLFERQLAMSVAARTSGRALRLAITPKGDPGRILGAINLNNMTRGFEGRGTVNWWIMPGARRQGLVHEAAAALLDMAFDDLPQGCSLQRVDGLIDPANFASLRLAERLCMRPQPGRYEIMTIRGRPRAHQLYSVFARLPPLPASMIELKPLPGLDAILRGAVRA